MELIDNEHERKRFLQSLIASWKIGEFSDVAKKAGITNLEILSPVKFSEENLEYHSEQISQMKVRDHEFDRLFAIYVIRKKPE